MLSLQQNRNSLFRADALLLGGDILDRMRANPLQNYAGVGFSGRHSLRLSHDGRISDAREGEGSF